MLPREFAGVSNCYVIERRKNVLRRSCGDKHVLCTQKACSRTSYWSFFFRNRLQATNFPAIFTLATACVYENDEFPQATEHAINNPVLNFFNVHGSVHRNNILIYIQLDATLHSLFISGNCSTCFGWYHHPSSGAQTTVSTASGICHTVAGVKNTRCCRYSCMRS